MNSNTERNTGLGGFLPQPALRQQARSTVYRSISSTAIPQRSMAQVAGPYRALGVMPSRDQVTIPQQQSFVKNPKGTPQQETTFFPENKVMPISKYFADYLPVDLQDYGLDACSYAFSSMPLDQLVVKLLSSLDSASIDHDEVRSENCKCKCVAYTKNGGMVEFCMRIFKLTPAEQEESGRLGNLLIVLQRYGAVFPGEWKQIVNGVFWKLVNEKVVATNFTISAPSASDSDYSAELQLGGSLSKPPSLDRTPSIVAEQERNLKHLLQLVQSPFADVKQQASDILLSLSRNVDNASLLARLEAVQCLCNGINANHDETDWTRAAISTIANVCEKHKFDKDAERNLVGVLDVVVQLFLALKDSTSYLKQELKRETARALAELTAMPPMKEHLVHRGHQVELKSAVQSCLDCGDARLSSLASRALGNLAYN